MNRSETREATASQAAGPRVDVICPFYQAERFLDETIRSVLAQEFGDFHLFLVDDGSTDAGSQIARDYAARDRRVRYLEHPGHANRGTCASRNLGLREGKADLLAFIDADDVWRPGKLGDQVALLDRMPDVDAVCGTVNYWSSHAGGEDRLVVTGHVANHPVAPPEALVKVYPFGHSTPPCPSDLMMRRDIVERIGGFEESFTGPLQLYEDQAFLTKFYLEGTIYFSDAVWLDYRVHDDSCVARVNREGLQPEVRRHYLEWFEAYLARSSRRGDPRVRLALLRSLLPYRHPHLSRMEQMARRLLRRLRGRRVGREA